MLGQKRRGQVLVMVTLALVAMCGMLGLVVDLGWAYYTRKSAQAGADSAALAAALQGYSVVGQKGPYTCGANLTCQSSPAPCPGAGNLNSGCLYAQAQGFTAGGDKGRQNVLISADTTSPPPTVPGVTVFYWTTVRVSESIPQLFSAVLGNATGSVSARATAAIADTIVQGNLWALNRENDPGPNGAGVDIFARGNGSISTGTILMASDSSTAGELQGASGVTAIATLTRGTVSDPHSHWNAPPQTGMPDLANFQDPMRGKGQPPAPTGLNNIPVPGGTINGNCSNPTVLAPGNYYATGAVSCGKNCTKIGATGAPITFSGCVTVGNGPGTFNDFVFWGGVNFSGGTTTFSPGEYILAGSTNGTIWAQSTNATVTDVTPLDSQNNAVAPGSNNGGEIFVFTNANYLNNGLQVPGDITAAGITNSLAFGSVAIQMGNNSSSVVNLHGLNRGASNPPPADLTTFAPVVWWQDQANTTILYDANGNVDYTSCGAGHTLDNPCTRSAAGLSPDISLQAHPNLHMWGAIYQPRGSSMTFQGNGGITSPLMLVTGSFSTQGGADLTLKDTGTYITRRIVSLIE